MRVLKLLLILSVIIMTLPARAADQAPPERVQLQKDQSLPGTADRPQQEAVKMSPAIRVSPSRPDESGRMHRIMVPTGAESPVQDVPALKDVSPPDRGEPPP